MRLTVIICTHDRADLLSRTLTLLQKVFYPEDCNVDLLVVANACSDNTHEVLRNYQANPKFNARFPLSWVEEPTPGKSHALNHAITIVNCDAVAFVDDDHRVDVNYLTSICKTLQKNPDTDIFCGRILPDWDGTEPAWVHETGPYRIYPLPVPRYEQGDSARVLRPEDNLPGGGNWVIRSRLFPKVEPFSTKFGPVGHNLGGAEDLEWLRRALHTGAHMCYEPSIVQYHYVDGQRLRLGYLMRKAYTRSSSTVRLTDRAEVPLYAYRKVAQHLLDCIFCFSWQKRRFYLVRLAAALGEIEGFHWVARQQRRYDNKGSDKTDGPHG